MVPVQAMETHREIKVPLRLFLTSTLDGEWSLSRPCRFTPGKSTPVTWVCPRAGLDTSGKKNLFPVQEIETSFLRCLVPSLVTVRTALSRPSLLTVTTRKCINPTTFTAYFVCNFHRNLCTKHADRQADIISPLCFYFAQFVQSKQKEGILRKENL